jgi:hypothetical protein
MLESKDQMDVHALLKALQTTLRFGEYAGFNSRRDFH